VSLYHLVKKFLSALEFIFTFTFAFVVLLNSTKGVQTIYLEL
jgi:hypothetical protein